jgi:hypothetical protein
MRLFFVPTLIAAALDAALLLLLPRANVYFVGFASVVAVTDLSDGGLTV